MADSEVSCDHGNIFYYIWICLVSIKCFAKQYFVSSNLIRHLSKEILFQSAGDRQRLALGKILAILFSFEGHPGRLNLIFVVKNSWQRAPRYALTHLKY